MGSATGFFAAKDSLVVYYYEYVGGPVYYFLTEVPEKGGILNFKTQKWSAIPLAEPPSK